MPTKIPSRKLLLICSASTVLLGKMLNCTKQMLNAAPFRRNVMGLAWRNYSASTKKATIGLRQRDFAAVSEPKEAEMDASVKAMESILKYGFNNKRLLEEALTHPSCTNSASCQCQRLAFLGDAVLNFAVTGNIFRRYVDLDTAGLTELRSVNVRTEKLARVAVRHKLYNHVRHNSTDLVERVNQFVMAVQKEDETVIHGGSVKAPKVLADIVEAMVGAVHEDSNYDLARTWNVFKPLLEPIITLDMLHEHPQPAHVNS